MRFAFSLLVLVGCATTHRPTPNRAPLTIHTTVQAAPREQPGKPPVPVTIASGGARLEIVEVTITPTGICRPSEAMLIVDAVVHNHGDDFAGAPDYGLVGAHRDKFGSLIGNGGFTPAIRSGANARVTFPIFFPMHDPDSANRKSRWEVALDVYKRYPGQMSDKILVRYVEQPCSRRAIAR